MTGMEFGFILLVHPSNNWVSDCYREHRNDGDGIGVNTVTQLVTVTEMTWMEVGPYCSFILPVPVTG